MPQLSTVFSVVDLVGIVLNGIIGGTIARQRHFDVIGFVTLAIMSAMGGGLVRDVLLGVGRPAAVSDPIYLEGAIVGAFIAFVANLHGRPWRVFFVIADSVVLGAWAATGTQKALTYGVHWLPAIVLGLATAIGGGMIRDVSAGMVPQVFGGNTLYAVPGLLSCLIVLTGWETHLDTNVTLALATLVGAVLAMASAKYSWRLPVHGDGTYSAARRRLAAAARRTRHVHPREDHPTKDSSE